MVWLEGCSPRLSGGPRVRTMRLWIIIKTRTAHANASHHNPRRNAPGSVARRSEALGQRSGNGLEDSVVLRFN